MRPWTDSNGPSVESGVLARLRRLDPKLRVTFSFLSINPFTGVPLGTRFGYVPDPAFHLWSQDPDGRWWLVRSYAAEVGFDHREVAMLEQDAARFFSPSEILRRRLDAKATTKERRRAAYEQYHADAAKANSSRIKALIQDEKIGIRQGRIVSYAGQGRRATPGEVSKDAREDGWEVREPGSRSVPEWIGVGPDPRS